MIIWSSINFPTVICLPTVCYFSREKPLVKSTAPGSLLYYICHRDLFLFAFIFRSIFTKTKKYLAALYFILHLFAIYLSNLSYFYPVNSTISGTVTRKRGCKYLFFVWRYRLRSVAWFSYWFDDLGVITEGNTYRRCAASSFLFGEIQT